MNCKLSKKQFQLLILQFVVVLTLLILIGQVSASALQENHEGMDMKQSSGMDHSSGEMNMDHGSSSQSVKHSQPNAQKKTQNYSFLALNIFAFIFVFSFIAVRGKRHLSVAKRKSGEVDGR